MNSIFKTMHGVNIKKSGSSEEVNVEIITFNQNVNFLYLKTLDPKKTSIFFPEDKIELKIIHNDGIYFFDTNIIKIDNSTGQLCINSPKKAKKMDRRKNTRHKFETELQIVGSSQNHYGLTFDLSEGGLGFYSKDFFYTGDILFLSFHSKPENRKYHIEVTIKDLFVQDDGYIKYGAEFADWIDDDFQNLVKYLKRKESTSSKNETSHTEIEIDPNSKNNFFNKFILQRKKNR